MVLNAIIRGKYKKIRPYLFNPYNPCFNPRQLMFILAKRYNQKKAKKMKRRDFYKNTLGAIAATTLTSATFADNEAHRRRKFPRRIIKPQRLKKGATIGLISPASPVSESAWQKTITNLEGLGFKLVYDEKRVLAKNGYLAGSDEERAKDVNRMFADDKIDGIWCVRGGYGTGRILPMLDYKMIKKNPKVLIGYSDITALLSGIFLKTGLVGFHGPVGASTYSDYTKKHVLNVLMNPQERYVIDYAKENLNEQKKEYQPYEITSGKASGRLVGGNLTLVSSLMGTPYELDFKNRIVFLEDIGEKPYRLDRMLTQLLLAGKLQQASGIALGIFNGCEKSKNDNSFTLQEMLKDRLQGLNIPVVYGLSFGHIDNSFTLPMGVNAEMDTANQRLTLLESAVL